MAEPKLNATQVDNVQYDNTVSSLTATDMKAAIDELQSIKIPNTGNTSLTAGFGIGNTTNANSIDIPTSSNVLTIEGGASGVSKSTTTFNISTVETSFDGGAAEYILRQGGPTSAEDIVDKGYVDNKFIESDETVVTNGVKINNIVAAPTADIDALGSPDANTIYIPNDSKVYEYVQFAISDNSSTITSGTDKGYAPIYFAGVLTEVYVHVKTPGTGTGITVDINKNGSTVLSTKLTTDATEADSRTATIPAVISDTAVAIGDVFNADIDVAATSSSQAVVTLKIERT